MGWNAGFAKNSILNAENFAVSLTNDCDGNQVNYNNNLPAIGNKNYALQEPLEAAFLTVIGYAKTYIYLNCRIYLLKMKIQFCHFNTEKL